MKNNKIMSTLVVLTLVLSGMMVLNTTKYGLVNHAAATYVSISNDGSGGAEKTLTCGEVISIEVNDNSLNATKNYDVKVWNGNGSWVELEDGSSDGYGNIAIDFNVPSWDDLGVNPLTNNGTYNWSVTDGNLTGSYSNLSDGQWYIGLFDSDGTVQGGYQTITIGNMYDVRYKYNDEWLDYMIYNQSYASSYIEIYIYNWTSSGWDYESLTDNFNISIFYPDGSEIRSDDVPSNDIFNWVVIANSNNNYNNGNGNLEFNYWVNVTVDGSETTQYSNATLPVKINMTHNAPSNAEWGDTISFSGYVLDGQTGGGIPNYNVSLYAPTNGGYESVYSTTTQVNGLYSVSAETGSDQSTGHAGTWYIGTYDNDCSWRINETDSLDIPGFISYGSFEVATKDDARVTIENSDDIISDFDQTINISVKNESWMESSEFENMYVHITGIESYNSSTGEYTEDDIVQVFDGEHNDPTYSDDDYAYYQFSYHFNSTGTATVWVSYSGNLTSIENSDYVNPVSGYYTKKYNNSELQPDITGSKSFSVVGADDMNLVIDDGMVESVQVDEGPGSLSSDRWINGSDQFVLKVFGASSSDPMNATIDITGCGLDIKIDEDNPTSSEYCSNHTWTNDQLSSYTVTIAPKVAGTLTITATNGTSDKTVSQDYTITGLSGTVTTSDGDDLRITVGTTETIAVDVTNGQYAEVHLTYFDTDWTKTDAATVVLNETTGDGSTEGEGLNGMFTFVPDAEDLENLGYIVVAAKVPGPNYMYDIIEIEPVYDLEIELIKPTLANATPIITVGLEQDMEFRLVDSDGNVVDEGDPSVTVKLIDEDNDEDSPLMQWTSSGGDIDQSGDEWELDNLRPYWKGQLVITGTNASDGIAHEGNLTLDVEYATITYNPSAATAGIGTENLTISVTGIDANGDPLPEDTRLYFYCNDSVNSDVGGQASNTNGVDFGDTSSDYYVDLDEDGVGEFELSAVGDIQTTINATIQILSSPSYNPTNGNATLGEFNINYPNFALNPDIIYIGQSNDVEITATDTNGDSIQGINLTFVSSVPGILAAQPDPVMTNADGIAELSISPQASGKLNVTIARDLAYEDGQLNWTNSVVTDSVVTVTSIKTMKISISKSPIYQGETLTVTVTSGGNELSGVDVEFAETTAQTDSNGEATFTVPDPGVESATYTITAEKSGYTSADKSITVIKVYTVQIVGPTTPPAPGEEFTVSIIANGAALAGATVEFNGNTYTSNARGEITLTAPDSAGSYTVTAAYENYEDGTLTITVDEGDADGVPGFELLTLVAALGVAFILLRRRRQ